MNHAGDPDALRRDWMQMSNIEGKVALVAGGGSGIGEAIAIAFAANGVRVVVSDLRVDMAENVAALIKSSGGDAIALAMDVSQQADIDRAMNKTISIYGQIDMLVNSAGFISPQPLTEAGIDVWRKSFEVNVEGALLLARTALPHLRKSDIASVVNISSLAGASAFPNGGSYGSSKAALIQLSQTMGIEWAEHGVRVNVINPGAIRTPLLIEALPEATQKSVVQRIPMKRMGVPREIADLALFLCSPAASYITAQQICCDGGRSQALMADLD
ncbi:SDR family oxidoreductase [Roseibium sp. HPY-6]|uniref:SDR family NAD(P)-dependent oxidoreductase n=1 Tax=Roseibium sp. HPY-6 TaxID=3229852 RepID=UPI0033904BD6